MEVDNSDNYSDVIIIGAGPAGLAVAGCLRRNGIPFVILEQAADVGSKWRQHYDRLHLHTAKRFSALPHFPFPAEYPTYASRQQFVDYLAAYAQCFQIEPRFKEHVESVRRMRDQWEVNTEELIYHSRCVVIATGANHLPHRPTWPSQESYQGTILHSADYKNGDQFRGKPTLVIGFGNSGTEIAIDLWEHGSIPSMAVRSPVNVVSRDIVGLPMQYLSVLLQPLPPRLVDRLNAPLVRLKFGNLELYGLRKLPYGAMTQINSQTRIPVIDIGIMKLIRDGHVTIHPGVESFTEDGVVFSDGVTGYFDGVILATGYQTALSNILPSEYRILDDKGYLLSDETTLPGLYFCGFHVSSAGMLYEIARESQRIVQEIAQK